MGISLSFLNQITPYSIILKRNKIILHHILNRKTKKRKWTKAKNRTQDFNEWFKDRAMKDDVPV